MVHRAGLKIKRVIHLFTKILNMENNISQNSISLICNKSDASTQVSLSNDSEPLCCESDNHAAEIKEHEPNPDVLANKRKVGEWVDYVKNPKKFKPDATQMRPGFSEERFDETSYYFENGLRKVYPYYFTFTTYTKGRWVGKTLLEVFGKEFRAHSSEEYEQHIKNGSLTINNECVTPDYVLKHNDLLANVVHRHEVPVSSDAIDIIHMDKDIVVVNKPASIPVHPCGRYRHNTIIFLLGKEYNLKGLKTIHRLDRLTSGVLIFGRTQARVQTLEAQIRDREVSKQYVCRVEGKFPESIECNEPIEIVSHQIGVCKVSPRGKKCLTSFEIIGYNEQNNTSVVLCKPYSGRMHQIRVHLQYLGYPIKNDPLYNNTIFGPDKGRGGNFGKTDDQLVKDLIYAHNVENVLKTDEKLPFLPVDIDVICDTKSETPLQMANAESTSTYNDVSTQTGIDIADTKFVKSKLSVDPHCQDCKIHYKDPEPKNLIMYLHALKYSGPDWAYETPMPVWADVNWTEP